MNPNVYGTSQGDIVRINNHVLAADSPRDMIETMAHEYRHQWQDQVLEGQLEHPLGWGGLTALTYGDISYKSDANWPEKYAANYRELDAEAFARTVYESYADSQEDDR